jgi:hypothetical protein
MAVTRFGSVLTPERGFARGLEGMSPDNPMWLRLGAESLSMAYDVVGSDEMQGFLMQIVSDESGAVAELGVSFNTTTREDGTLTALRIRQRILGSNLLSLVLRNCEVPGVRESLADMSLTTVTSHLREALKLPSDIDRLEAEVRRLQASRTYGGIMNSLRAHPEADAILNSPALRTQRINQEKFRWFAENPGADVYIGFGVCRLVPSPIM